MQNMAKGCSEKEFDIIFVIVRKGIFIANDLIDGK